ncbi:hypothetical protein [Pseudomonas aeruginosa]|uniref:hypothetical protein n=1 Tax=Pseudomonas aeruginosa TaxID=287 RepID=UPI0019D4E7A7|nr:hypothetical protein [Pseudomonas aeruginosa]
MSNELTDVRCPCGAEFQADSYDAGFIAGSGMCQNCDAALPPKDICTCPSGDGSLRHPCPAHPAVEQAVGDERDFQAEGAQEVPSPVSQEYDRHLISLLRKGEALPGHQEEAADEIERLRDWNDHLNNTVLPNILNPNFLMLMKGGERLLDLCTKDGKFIGVSLNDMKDVFDWMVTHARIAPDHAALAQPSPMRCLACGGYHGNSGLPCPNMRVTAQAQPSPAQAEQHWPKLEKPAQVGAIRFSAGVSSRLVVEAAQRLYEFESTPEKEAERIERLQAFREQLDPLNLAPHAEAFNEAPAEALKPEQAEAERPEMSSERAAYFMRRFKSEEKLLGPNEQAAVDYVLSLIAQHERIVGVLRAEIAEWQEAAGRSRSDVVAYIAERAKLLEERDAAMAEVEALRAELQSQRERNTELIFKLGSATNGWGRCEKERDAALARVADLERQEPVVRAYGVLPPFAEKVLAKLRRFNECAEDPGSGGVDIGRHWLDLLTQLGLLNRVQRSPALWEITQQGEDLLGTPQPSPAQAEKAEAERPEWPTEDELEAAGLGYPLHKEEAVKLWYSGFRSEVITVLEAWEAIGHDIGMNPDKGELLDSLRYMLEKCEAHDAALAEVAGLRSLLNSLLCYVERDIDRMRSDRDKSDNKEIYDRSISLAMERLKAAQNAVFTTEPGCDTAVELAAQTTQAQHCVPEGLALIPVRETEAMHDAVMALLYKGVARTDTQKLLDAYIAAAPQPAGGE